MIGWPYSSVWRMTAGGAQLQIRAHTVRYRHSCKPLNSGMKPAFIAFLRIGLLGFGQRYDAAVPRHLIGGINFRLRFW